MGKTDVLLAEVGTRKIYKSDVEKMALENYSKSAITEDVIKIYLDTLIERAVLDQEAVRLGISISKEEVESALASIPSVNAKISQKYKEDQAEYKVLKSKLIKTQTASVQAYVIGFWLPPKLADTTMTFEETPELSQSRSDGEIALIEISEALSANTPPIEIAQQISDVYPSLRESLTLNGYNFINTKDTLLFEQPRTYIKNDDRSARGVNDSFYKTLFSLKENEVETVIGINQTGGDVIQVVSVQLDGFSSYQEYLQSKIKESVIKHI